MRHGRTTKKLGRTASHRKAMLRNLVTSLLREERVVTTHSKARVARSLAERYITKAKHAAKDPGTALSNRRLVAREIQDEAVLKKLFAELGPRFAERPGGYTRIMRMGQRDGDAAHVSMLEILGAPAVVDRTEKDPKKGRKGRAQAEARAAEQQAAGEAAEGAETEKAPKKKDAKVKAEEKAAKKEKRDAEKEKRKASKAAAGEGAAKPGRGGKKKDEKGGGPGGKGKASGGARRRLFGRKSG